MILKNGVPIDHHVIESGGQIGQIQAPSIHRERAAERGDLRPVVPGERQVLEAVAHGLTSPQIGERLGISPKTVSRHRERIMKKLGTSNVADLVKFAIRTGLVELE